MFGAAATTGIYCRPGCEARPWPDHVRRFATAAAAEAAGYRACLRCRPYCYAQPAGWNGPELVCRAVRMILAGALDGDTETALGARLGVSARHLRRLFLAHVGATPDQLARSSRAHFARRLLDDTELSVPDIAFAAGFGSLRQLNRSFKEVFRASPQQLRAKRRKSDRLVADGGIPLRLSFRGRLDWDASPAAMAAADPADLATLGIGTSGVRALLKFADAVAGRQIRLDRSAGLAELLESLTAIPGISRRCAHYIAFRLGECDAFPVADLDLRRASRGSGSGDAVGELSRRWRPWRALVATHLWVAGRVGYPGLPAAAGEIPATA